MAFLPVAASSEIAEKYKRYLKTIFRFKDQDYQKQFEKLLQSNTNFANGPFLDVTDSFEKGKSLSELIDDGIVPAGISRLHINQTRPLYLHQQISTKKVLSGKNVVVSTGTGSGKTESFLIPLLSEIIAEHEAGTLDSGVRALIIYPMNALANDQMERLRELLLDYPDITYGSYTGQTRDKYNDALAEYRKLNNDQKPNENELISREQMKATPPNILITNYAMLEYLMVRPDDAVFFNKMNSPKWKYIILDEAHVYSGSTGIEVSMLLRRLQATLKNNNIKYILTSATLGDEKSNKEVAQFATNLCATSFKEDDIVRAHRVRVVPQNGSIKLPIDFYVEMAEELKLDIPNINQVHKIIRKYNVDVDKTGSIPELLYDVLINDETFISVKNYMSKPRKVVDISGTFGWRNSDTESFVIVASKAIKNGISLFDARYHMFLKATDSVFITLAPNKRVFLDRCDTFKQGEEEFKVFEAGTCASCHSIFLAGTIENDKLVQRSSKDDELGNRKLYLLEEEYHDTDEDLLLEDNADIEPYELCPHCGFIRRAGVVSGKGIKNCCEHGEKSLIKVWQIDAGEKLHKCPSCEATSPFGIVRFFFSGQEAVTSVIGTALFEAIPSQRETVEIHLESDDSGFGFDDEVEERHMINEAKQFIAFSDSRQAAAFYASYMDKTYKSILYKHLIVETLNSRKEIEGKPLNLFADSLVGTFEKYNICDKNTYVKKEAWLSLLNELIDNNSNTSLSKMGLMEIGLNDQISIPGNGNWKLSSEDVRSIVNEFILSMLTSAAVMQDEVSVTRDDWKEIAPGGVTSSFTYSDSDAAKFRKAFIPTKVNLSNKRIDYIKKIASKVGMPDDSESCKKFLNGLWNHILISKERGILYLENGSYKVDATKLSLRQGRQAFICPRCGKITYNNVKGVCPTYRCDGELELVDLETMYKDNHYYELYKNMEARPLRIVEHTAQLSRNEAYEYQKDFKNKKIDVLSCSTTFEMGVDVGTLETVFMRNMPPSPSNYAQRAGRAGRSVESAAFALTFCNKSNHDFTFFNDPVQMIRGKILPPLFNIENEKIAIRHVYASAVAFFWKKHPEFFAKTEVMLGNGSDEPEGYKSLIEYIESKPSDLHEFIISFLPNNLVKALGVDDFRWADKLIGTGEEKGVFIKAFEEYRDEVQVLLKERERRFKEMKGIGYLDQRLRTFYSESILAFLARKGVFPRYGFPVDTVELGISSDTNNEGVFGLQLQRDLSMAISEYAPGSQVVANGNLITSRYIRKAPGMLWKMYDYKRCNTCDSIILGIHTDDGSEISENCPVCTQILGGIKSTFIIPELGFIADEKGIAKPGLTKPNRTYNNEIAYIGNQDDAFEDASIGKSKILMMHSQKDEMVVINESNFFVCPMCGYTEVDKDCFKPFKVVKHKVASGKSFCKNEEGKLTRRSLGYKFQTSVLQIRFENPILNSDNRAYAYSVLQGIIRGLCTYFSIDDRDVSGCLHYYFNKETYKGAYSIILYDATPGGSGYVNMIDSSKKLEEVLKCTLEIMKTCNCGGEDADTSCYSCLRNYYNQKHHDEMKRGYVIDFIEKVLG